MSNVEGVRKAVQDFIAPDLKALGARLEALEREMKFRFEHVEKEMKARSNDLSAQFDHVEKVSLERFAAAEKMAASRHETYLANHVSVMSALDMDRRLAKLES